MVDNGRLEAGKADDVDKETLIPLTCSSSLSSVCTEGYAQLSITDIGDDGENDAVIIDNENDKSTSALSDDTSDSLRQIVIDGSNIAMSHGNRTTFSCRGIKLAVHWFQRRGHKSITVFVPQWRRESHKQECIVTDPQIMLELELQKILVFTPSRKIRGKRIVCHDDRYIVKLAVDTDGVIVSNDTYRDLVSECQEFRKAIEERLLMYSFVNDRFMPPDDPLGRHGPSLDHFLRKTPLVLEPQVPICPYAKCTFGAKCRYYHPERASSYHRSNSTFGSGDKLQSGSAAENRNSGGNSTTPCCKKKLASTRRSYEKQSPENKHLHAKPFNSDPTYSSSCGHLALANKLSRDYKHIPDSSVTDNGRGNVEYNEAKTNRPIMQDGDAVYKPEKRHQQLTRKKAIQGNDSRLVGFGQTFHVNSSVEAGCRDTINASTELSVAVTPASEVSNVSSLRSSVDTASATQLDTNSSLPCTNRINQTKPELPQLSLSSGPQQFVAARRNSQDHVPAVRFTPPPPLLPSDNLYFVRPVVFPCDYVTELHSCRRFSAPQLMSRIHMSPSWPQMFAYQSQSCLPQNELMRHPAISTHRFLHR